MGINSKYNHINNHTQLMYTIMQLNASRAEQEEEIKYKVKEIYFSFQPATLLKNAFNKLMHHPETQKKFFQFALSMIKSFLISKIVKRGTSIKGFLSSIVLEKIGDYALNAKSDLVSNGIGKLRNLITKKLG